MNPSGIRGASLGGMRDKGYDDLGFHRVKPFERKKDSSDVHIFRGNAPSDWFF